MKKILVLAIAIGLLSCFSLKVSADDIIKDNNLQIDNSRLEENQEVENNSPLKLAEALFSVNDRVLLEKNKENVKHGFEKQQEQLFVKKTDEKITTRQLNALFSSSTTGQYVTKINASTDSANQTNGVGNFYPLLYGGLSVLLICGACFATYKVNQGEE